MIVLREIKYVDTVLILAPNETHQISFVLNARVKFMQS